MDHRDRLYLLDFWSTLPRAVEASLALIYCFQTAGLSIHSNPFMSVAISVYNYTYQLKLSHSPALWLRDHIPERGDILTASALLQELHEANFVPPCYFDEEKTPKPTTTSSHPPLSKTSKSHISSQFTPCNQIPNTKKSAFPPHILPVRNRYP